MGRSLLFLIMNRAFILLALLQGAIASTLLTVNPSRSGNDVKCCSDPTLQSCQLVSVDMSVIGQDVIDVTEDMSCSLVDMKENVYYYEGDDARLVLNYDPELEEVAGIARTSDGIMLSIEKCGSAGYVYKETTGARKQRGFLTWLWGSIW